MGHSDIAPLRKKDPGEKFPWHFFIKIKLVFGIIIKQKLKINLKNAISNELQKKFFINLKKFGYEVKFKTFDDKKKIIKSFQRRFRPELVSGIIDIHTYSILKSLI